MINRTLFKRISVGLIPVAAAMVLLAETNSVTVKMRDDCDPTTFNAAIGPGTCVGKGDTTFQRFLNEFQKEGSVDDWEFTSEHETVEMGGAVKVTNRGGETHTFTKVAVFGGGFVPLLNGSMAPAPECLAPPNLVNNLFVAPGQSVTGPFAGSVTLPAGQKTKFQCCIHPWMRVQISAK